MSGNLAADSTTLNPTRCTGEDVIKEYKDLGQVDRAEAVKGCLQCMDCGSAGKLYRENLCGTCRVQRAEEANSAAVAQTVQDMQAHRAVTTQFRGLNGLYHPAQQNIPQGGPSASQQANPAAANFAMPPPMHPPPAPFAPTLPQPSGRTAPSTRSILVNFQAVLSHKKDARGSSLGNHSRSYSSDTEIDEIIQDYLNTLNLVWEKRSISGLTRADVELRWAGNIMPERGSDSGSLGEFYDTHYATAHRDVYFGKGPLAMKHYKGQKVNLVLLIDVARFDERTDSLNAGLASKASKGKRARATSVATWDGHKKPRTQAQPLVSKFRPVTAAMQSTQPAATDILLQLSKLKISASGQFTVSWDDADIAVHKATINDVAFAQGQTKKVYAIDIRIDHEWKPFVAKRFFQVGKGPNIVTCTDNASLLELEAQRLYFGQYFLDAFLDRAEVTGTEIAENFDFSTCFLAKEFLEIDNTSSVKPSPASGVRDTWDAASHSEQESGVVWLIEPRRSRVVDKWSGTLDHPYHKDKLGATLDAFVHFGYEYSQSTLVFADLQTSKGLLRPRDGREPGEKGHVLFDIMTHSQAGVTGVGDHGEDGIRNFLSKHLCNPICEELGLLVPSLSKHDAARLAETDGKGTSSDLEDEDEQEHPSQRSDESTSGCSRNEEEMD
ncbi:hypothetical protein VTO73DRAFT_4882 [Trametes versicolor]